MTKIRYVGQATVDLPTLGHYGVTRGVVVDVPAADADLLVSTGNWARPGRAKGAARKASAARKTGAKSTASAQADPTPAPADTNKED